MRFVTQEQKNLISEIIQMREQYLAEVGIDKRRAWPKSIRERVLQLFAQKTTGKYIADATGISYDTIRNWVSDEDSHGVMFQPMSIRNDYSLVPPPQLPTTNVSRSPSPICSEKVVTVTVTTPDGYQVSGSVKEVFRVLNRLRRS